MVSGQQYWTQTGAGGSVTTTSSCTINNPAQAYNNGGCNATPSGDISSSTVYIVDTEGNITSNNNGTYSGSLTGSCSYCTTWYDTNSKNTGCTGSCIRRYSNGCSCCANSTYVDSCTASASGSSLAVRPVLTLKNTVTLQGGNGTTTSPYYLN